MKVTAFNTKDYHKGKIPGRYLAEWYVLSFNLFKRRMQIIGCSAIIAFLIGHILHSLVIHGFTVQYKVALIGAFTALNFTLLFLNSRTKNIWQTKGVGFFVTLSLMTFFINTALQAVAMGFPYVFATTMIIVFFFISLMLPWSLTDVLILSAICLYGLIAYHGLLLHRAGSEAHLLLTQNEFWNGALSLFVSTLFCMVVRYQDNKRNVENYVLLKQIEHEKNKVEKLNQQMKNELKLARAIHETMIPHTFENDRLAISVLYKPISEIGGDYANFIFVTEKSLLFLMSDVTGHGVPAALVVSRFESEFQRLAKESKSPGEVLGELNRFMIKNLGGTGMYLSAFCGRMDLDNETLTYSNYGHPDQYLLNTNKEVVALPSQTTLVGVLENEDVYECEERLSKGDRIVLFTDGLIEATNQAGEQFGNERVTEILKNYQGDKSSSIGEALQDALAMHRHQALEDDVFILSLQYKS